MTDSLNNTLKNLQNKHSQINSDTEQQKVSKNQRTQNRRLLKTL